MHMTPSARRAVRRRWGAALAGAVLAVFAAAGCDLPEDEREPPGRMLDTHSLLTGDCVWRPQSVLPVWGMVKVVECSSGSWQYRVVNRVHIDGDGPRPSDEAVLQLADEQCAAGWTSYLAPNENGWSQGYRWMLCFADQVRPDA